MSRSTLVVAAAGFAVALAATACASTPTRTPSASPVVSTSPSLPVLAGWQQVELPVGDALVRLTTLVATRTGFVAAAGTPDGPMAWSSADGATWIAETVPGDERTPTDAIWWGDRLLMVGSGGAPGCGHPVAIDTWVRDGPGLWNEAPFQQVFCAGGSAEVAVAGGLAVIVGAGAGDQPYAWSSVDGLHWVDHPAVFADAGLPSNVLATSAGFVALGMGQDGAWFKRSADGVTWRTLARLPGSKDARPLGAAVLGTRLVVFLGDPAGPVQRLSSVEPSAWTVDTIDGLVASSLIRVEKIPGGLVAIGGDEQGPALWVSDDGFGWRRVDLPQAALGGYIADVAIGHGRAVILGGLGGQGGNIKPAAWVGPDSPLAP